MQIRVFKNVCGERKEVEILPIKPGKEYILYTHGKEGRVISGKKVDQFWHGPWTVSNGQKCYSTDPHACLKKDQQCNLCIHVAKKDGRLVEKDNVDPHRSLAPGTECPVCSHPKMPASVLNC